MFISQLTLDDCQNAALLHQKAFYKGWDKKDFEDFLRDPLVYGLKLKDNNLFYGFVLWREIKEEAEILTFVIASAYQAQGKGTFLLTSFFETLKEKGINEVFLEVAEDNPSAYSFYLKYGFNLLSKRPGYYSREGNKPVAALNLSKKLV